MLLRGDIMVHTSSVPLFWRLQKNRYMLTGTRCKICNTAYFPPKNFCPKCRRKGDIEELRFSGNGKIVSYTTIRVPPEGFENYTPYVVAIIELEEGGRISGQVIGELSDIVIGKAVKPVFRKIQEDGTSGLIQYGIKFEIVDS